MSKLRFSALICGKHLKFGFSTTKFPTTMNGIPLILICALFFAKNGLAQQRVNMEDVRLIQQDSLQQVDVFVGGKLFTTYIYRTGSMKKPVLFPINSADGQTITRGYPLATRPGERIDHPHHYGLWFNHGVVNGVDFWNNSDAIPESKRNRFYGSIFHQRIDRMADGDPGVLAVDKTWVMPDGSVVLDEKTEYRFRGGAGYRQIDHTTMLTAREKPVEFTDSKEGMFALRVARQLELPDDEAVFLTDSSLQISAEKIADPACCTGNYLNSEGLVGNDVWGKRARWVKLAGQLDGTPVALVIFDFPTNPNYPPHWMARGYGLFGVNPFGTKIYDPEAEALNFSLAPGASVQFRHRVLIFSGKDPDRETIETAYQEFCQEKN